MPTALKKNFILSNGLEVEQSIKIGDQTTTSLLDSSAIVSIASESSTAKTISKTGGFLCKSYDSADLLPSSGNDSGEFGFVTSTDRLYIWNGSGWYNIALINTTPTLSTTPDSNYSMDSVGASLSITILATDPEEVPITYSHVASDSAADLVTISQSDNVFTVSSLTQAQLDSNGYSSGGTFTITFRASDGVNIAPAVSSFTLTLSLGYDWTKGFQQSIITPSTRTSGAEFGTSVSLSEDGSYAAVGSENLSSSAGGVFIFTRSGSTWTQQASLTASDAASSDKFGSDVSLNKDATELVVGAQGEGGTGRGSIYIFTRSGSTWTQQQKITPGDISANDAFGSKVKINYNGDTIAVTSHGDDDTQSDSGAVYIYTKSGGTWSQQAKIKADTPVASQRMSQDAMDLSDDGNTLIAGAYRDSTNLGKTYIFTRSGSTWSQQAILASSDATASQRFGNSVGISGDGNTAAIGAWFDTSEKGALYIFTRSGSTWTQQVKIAGPNTVAGVSGQPVNEKFGTGVRMSGDGGTVIVSAPEADKVNVNIGALYVYTGSGSSWTQAIKLFRSTHEATANSYAAYHTDISHDGNIILLGAEGEDDGANSNSGAAYAFAAPVASTPDWTAAAQEAQLSPSYTLANYQNYGYTVDIKGDRALVGAQGVDSNAGKVLYFTRAYEGSAWTLQQTFTGSNTEGGDFFGTDVAMDENGTTCVVGAPAEDTGATQAGMVYVFTLSENTWTQTAQLQTGDTRANYDSFGQSVSIYNGTIAASAPQKDGQGACYIFTGSGSSWTQQAKLVSSDIASNDQFGRAISLWGDSVLVGAYYEDPSNVNLAGSAYVFTRSGSSWSQQAKLTASDAAASDVFGSEVCLVGDTAIVGAYNNDDDGTNSGSAYVYARSGSSWSQQQKLTASDASDNHAFGAAVAINKTDEDVVVVGAYGNSGGKAYTFTRSGSTWTQQQVFTRSDVESTDAFGGAVAVDNSSIIIGDYQGDEGGYTSSGAAFVFKA